MCVFKEPVCETVFIHDEGVIAVALWSLWRYMFMSSLNEREIVHESIVGG